MKCPICSKTLENLNIRHKDYMRGLTHKCNHCKKNFTIVGEDF